MVPSFTSNFCAAIVGLNWISVDQTPWTVNFNVQGSHLAAYQMHGFLSPISRNSDSDREGGEGGGPPIPGSHWTNKAFLFHDGN